MNLQLNLFRNNKLLHNILHNILEKMDVLEKVSLKLEKYPQKFIDSTKNWFQLKNIFNKKFLVFIIVATISKYFSEKRPEIPSDDIDWHDWTLIEEEKLRDAIGEFGEPANLAYYPCESELINATHGFNGYLSDQIALNRALKDLRPKM